MDEQQRRAEQLLEERMKSRKPNGATATEPADVDPAPAEAAEGDYKADLQRMAADFANYRKRNDAERTEFAKFAKADLITKLLDVLDGYDRALASVPDDVKGQAGNDWVEGMWLAEPKRRQNLHAEGLDPICILRQPVGPDRHKAGGHL